MSNSHQHRRPDRNGQPDYLYPPYVSSRKRAPSKPLILVPHTISESSGPVFGDDDLQETDSDLTAQFSGAPIGERIVVSGRVLDDSGHPVSGALIELWQANAAGRYRHKNDQHAAPLDPNFGGCGRVLTDSNGQYRVISIKPGAYPWQNHPNAWRPAHIHFSIFGAGLLTRLVTQMYFPGDPLMAHDPIFNAIRDDKARQRLIAAFDLATTIPAHALGYNFDIVLRGPEATPPERHP
jgi:protocatechuate 3,4-dioxygenase, beta subunit